MARAALAHLGDGGVILNTSSVTGLEGSKELLDYASTKGAINAFTQSLAQNLVERGIRVNAVAPGPVWTPLNPADRTAEEVAKFGQGTDMKRAAQPEELAFLELKAEPAMEPSTGKPISRVLAEARARLEMAQVPLRSAGDLIAEHLRSIIRARTAGSVSPDHTRSGSAESTAEPSRFTSSLPSPRGQRPPRSVRRCRTASGRTGRWVRGASR